MSNKYFSIISSLLISLNFGVMSAEALVRSPEPAISSGEKRQVNRASNRKTVVDYFLEIPAQYLKDPSNDRITTSKRQQMLVNAKRGLSNSIYDVNNGYLKLFRGGDTCGMYTIATFKRLAKSPLVARNISCTIGDYIVILDPDQNWKDVTPLVLPADLSSSPDLLTVILPRTGRTIEIHRENENNSQNLVGRYRFDGRRFVKS